MELLKSYAVRCIADFVAFPCSRNYDRAIDAIKACGVSRKDAVAALAAKHPVANLFREVK